VTVAYTTTWGVTWALSSDDTVRAEVLAAHDSAVDAALGWLQTHGCVTRRGTDGVDQVDAQGLCVALFRQHTSRSDDPQLHTHAVIWAKVQDPSGRWLALDARFLLRQQRSISWVYDAALRVELSRRLGVTWEPVAPGAGQADLVEVPEVLREVFSQRTAQVDSKLAELVRRWIDEHDGTEPDPRTIADLQRRAVLASRPPRPPTVPTRSGWLTSGGTRPAPPASTTSPTSPSAAQLVRVGSEVSSRWIGSRSSMRPSPGWPRGPRPGWPRTWPGRSPP
jgi:hypothetical protein